MMNLYIFHTSSEAAVYGIGTYIRELTSALRQSKVKVCVVNLRAHVPQLRMEETSDGIRRWYFPESIEPMDTGHLSDLYYKNIIYLLQLHIENKSHLIFHLNANHSSQFAKELKRAFDCRIVLTIHYFDWCFKLSGNLTHFRQLLEISQGTQRRKAIEYLKDGFQKEKETLEVVDHIICLSKRTNDILQNEYKMKPDKITVVYNGLADHQSSVEKSVLRQKYGIANAPIFLFAGRLDNIKGLKYALRAFKIVLKVYPESRFIIAGSGEFNGPLLECEDIYMNVCWTGLVSKEKLYELYTIADIGIMPSFHEQCSYVAIEMMMHGLPIIGSTSTGLYEMIENGVTGLHIPVIEYMDRAEIDSTVLAEKMLYLLQHPIETKRMGQNARRRYVSHYSSELFRKNMLKMYESCWHRDDGKINVLIVTGQNNHNWEVSHLAIKQILENSGLFTVHVAVSPETGKSMSDFNPDFASYQLVVLDYNGDSWSEETEKSFLAFVENGGGVVVYHAANNAFKDWKEYNRIIGLGGWGDRDETAGPYIYQQKGSLVYDEKSSGCAGSHGCRHEFVLHCGNPDHPVTKGLPAAWRHAQDELYDRMRGPGIIKDVLFWGYSDPETRGSGRDELVMFTVDYGKARIFHTTLGHVGNSLDDNIAMQCAGFQVTLLRGAEWAATGQVTQSVPDDFPTETTISLRKNYK